MDLKKVIYREDVKKKDIKNVKDITTSSGYFYDEEIEIAIELVEERLAKGIKSGYYFLFADVDGKTAGYSCYGPIACTKHSYDLFWIAVSDECRGQKVGTELLKLTEDKIKELGGKRIYVETSSIPKYESTRSFYKNRGYIEEAVIKDFYGDDDSKFIYVKVL